MTCFVCLNQTKGLHLTMVERFLKYIKFQKRYSENTIVSYQRDLNDFSTYIEKEFDIKSSVEVNSSIIKSWLMQLSSDKIAEKSINRKLASLKSFYKFLLKEELIEKNPTDRIKSLKTPKKLPVFVQENAMVQLLDNVVFENSFKSQRDKLIIELLYGTGIRLSELINLKNSNIDIYNKSIKVLGKGKKERIIPINNELLEAMNVYNNLKKSEHSDNNCEFFIVTDNIKKTYPMFIFRIVGKYLGMVTTNEKKSPHTLRHTFATHLLNKGADLNAIKELLGHTSLAATQVYTHNSIEKLKNIFENAHPKA